MNLAMRCTVFLRINSYPSLASPNTARDFVE